MTYWGIIWGTTIEGFLREMLGVQTMAHTTPIEPSYVYVSHTATGAGTGSASGEKSHFRR